LLAGVGVNWTEQLDKFQAPDSGGVNDYTSQLQGFLAAQYLLARRLQIKAVFGCAKAYFQASSPSDGDWTNYMHSGPIRLMYLY
jgi:hypothetical protein